LAGFTWGAATTMKIKTAASLTNTMTVLKRADSRTPIDSNTDSSSTMTMAGTLAMPPSSGALVSACGRCKPSSSRILPKYPDQPMATVEVAMAYSRIRSQPMIQAISSPMPE
jgi:hypothetical protein